MKDCKLHIEYYKVDKNDFIKISKENYEELLKQENNKNIKLLKKYFAKYPGQDDIEVNEDVYEVLKDSTIRQECKYDHELRRHIENKKTIEQVENEKANKNIIASEEQFINEIFNDTLLKIIKENLPEVQSRRIYKRFYQKRTFQDIANEEGVNKKSVWFSVQYGLKNLKKFLN